MNLRQDGRIINIPLYLLHRFPEIILVEGRLDLLEYPEHQRFSSPANCLAFCLIDIISSSPA